MSPYSHFSECLRDRPAHPTLPGDSAYEFKCGHCNANNKGHENFVQTNKGWLDIVRVALYNLVQGQSSSFVKIEEMFIYTVVEAHLKFLGKF